MTSAQRTTYEASHQPLTIAGEDTIGLLRLRPVALALLLLIPTASARAQPEEAWRELPPAPIEGRGFHTAIWTKEEMIVWGGSSAGKLFADGAALDTDTFVWRPIAPAPIAGRTGHIAVWTGEEMVIWGGCCDRRGREFGDGAAYDPLDDSWRVLSPAPIRPRTGHTAARGFGKRTLMIWGGHERDRAFADGAEYDAHKDRWALLPDSGIEGRYSHTAVGFGLGMLIWGGATATPELLPDGATFTGSMLFGGETQSEWTRIRPARPARSSHTAVLMGEMIVWGGCCEDSGKVLSGGAAYDPEAGTWRRLAHGPLSARQGHTATSTGWRMVIWGGTRGVAGPGSGLADGAAYNPERDAWSRVPSSPIAGRYAHTAVMTMNEIIIWGGCCIDAGEGFADGAALDLLKARIPSSSNYQALIPAHSDNGGAGLIAVLVWVVALIVGALLAASWRKAGRERRVD